MAKKFDDSTTIGQTDIHRNGHQISLTSDEKTFRRCIFTLKRRSHRTRRRASVATPTLKCKVPITSQVTFQCGLRQWWWLVNNFILSASVKSLINVASANTFASDRQYWFHKTLTPKRHTAIIINWYLDAERFRQYFRMTPDARYTLL